MAREWFVVKTKPRCERQASVVLEHRDIEVYLPELPRARRAGARSVAREPLFPGYLFARLALATGDWLRARSAPGVAYFVGAGGRPSAVPDDLVREIRHRSEERQRPGGQLAFRSGDQVIIGDGPFAGLAAVFERPLSPTGRVRVLLEILRRFVPVDLDVTQLQRPGEAW